MKRLKVCLTGGIACGKSLLSRYLREAGVETLDADDIVHELIPEEERRRLAKIVFKDPQARKALEARLHPIVKERIHSWLEVDDGKMKIAVIPLLFEVHWEKEFDILDKTCTDKFRKTGNVNQWLMKYWQLAEGNFVVRRDKFAFCYHVKEYNYEQMCRDIPAKKHQMICINDTADTTNFEEKKQGVISAFEKLLPDKSAFEI